MHKRRRVNWAAVLGLALVAAVGLVAYHVIAASRHAPGATTGAAAGFHRAIHSHATPSPAAVTSPVPNPYAHKVAIRLTAIEDCWV